MGIEVDFSAVYSKLDNMTRKIQNETLTEVLEAGAKPIIESMKKNCRYDHKNKGEHLRDNLGVLKVKGSGTNKTLEVGINSDDRKIVERGYYNHYGTCRIVGDHFIEKSFNESVGDANEEIKKALKEKLEL